jgi:hypothetical protein
MLNVLHQWLGSLTEAERALRSQGYIVVYGGTASFVVPVGSGERTPGQRGKPLGLWDAASGVWALIRMPSPVASGRPLLCEGAHSLVRAQRADANGGLIARSG